MLKYITPVYCRKVQKALDLDLCSVSRTDVSSLPLVGLRTCDTGPQYLLRDFRRVVPVDRTLPLFGEVKGDKPDGTHDSLDTEYLGSW